MATVWIVTPVYLDVVSFLILRDRLRAELAAGHGDAQPRLRFVVAEDSGGLDPEVSELAAFDDVLVVAPPFNLGHQRAIVYALRKVAPQMDDEDVVVTMDADGEDAPEDVPRLVAELEHAGSARVIVLAARTSRNESLLFKVFYFFFRVIFRLLTGTLVRSGNFAAYRGWVARTVLAHPHFDLCYSSTLTSLELGIHRVPCARAKRYAGHSRMNFPKLVRHGLSMLMPYLDRIAIRALILFSFIVVSCLTLGVAVLAIKLGTHQAVPGWATATLLGLAISSLVAVGNFVVLFAVYTQSQGMSLSNLEQQDHGRT
jgi:polyisoprenyl-phosphate glycosyltransferase